MGENEPIKFAVAGLGHIGKRHAEMIMRNPGAELVALCDVRPPSSLDLDYKAPFFNSQDMLFASNIDFDVLCVATPNGLHAEHAIMGLEHSKHIVIEKPMALRKEDCDKIIFKAQQVSRKVFCVMQNRYSPPSEWIKKVISQGLMGKIFMVQVNCYWNRDERYYKSDDWRGNLALDGGTLFTQFSHFIDMLYWLFGDIQDIQGKFNDFNHSQLTDFEDSGLVNFNFVNGGMGSINYSTAVWDMNMESSMTIIAEKGSVKIGGQYMNEVEYCHIKDYSMPKLSEANPANDYGNYKGSAANHNYVFGNVIETLKNRDKIATNAVEGMKVVDIIERIYSLNPYIAGKIKERKG